MRRRGGVSSVTERRWRLRSRCASTLCQDAPSGTTRASLPPRLLVSHTPDLSPFPLLAALYLLSLRLLPSSIPLSLSDPMRKTIRTMEMSPYQLLGSYQLTLTSAPGSDRRLNKKQKPMRTASGCRFPIAFGKASAQAPLSCSCGDL